MNLDNHFINMINHFISIVDKKDFEEDYNKILVQAKLISDVFLKANQ